MTASIAFASAPAYAQAITTIEENGRMVFVNDGTGAPSSYRSAARGTQAPPVRRQLVYWSNTERRWKPVPTPSPTAIRAARSAAAEVTNFIAAKPRSQNTASSLADPNLRRIARGYAVSAAEVNAAIEQAAARHNVDANLVRAIIKVESNFNPAAVSRKGAMGLMQLMPATARQLSVADPFDPQQNVDAGVRHLKTLLANFGGDLRLSLAAYNAGEGAVQRANGVPRYAETTNYVKQITSLYWNGGTGRIRIPTGANPAPVHTFRDPNGVLNMTNTD
jgi:soluble lytic murein transglycosylase-like protein